MRKVLTLACLLAVAHHVAAQCSSIPTYSETFVPECAQNDVYVNWPNYENQATYYKCNGIGNPVLANCPANQYFCFVLQQCVPCNQYIAAVPCSQLKTQNKPNCVPIEGGSTGGTPSPSGPTLPTPNYPSSTTTEKTTTTKSTTVKTTVSTTPTAPTIPTEGPTPPTEAPGPSTSDIPPPPSPVTNDPNIPMPPTPGPTPPSVVVTPPNVPSAPITG